MMNKELDIALRTRQFALGIVRMCMALPENEVTHVLQRQILRSGTSVGAQCREVRRSRSNAEMISKIECALQELDETQYWLELLIDSGVVSESKLKDLIEESNELISILVTSVKTIKQRTLKQRRSSQ